MSKEKKKRRMANLWCFQGGRCCYCQKPMLHWSDLRSDPSKVKKYGVVRDANGVEHIKIMPEDLATLEHLRDRYHPARQEQPRQREQRWALACWRCNTDRGNARTKERPIEELWERSRSRPLALVDQLDGHRNSTSAYAGSSPAERATELARVAQSVEQPLCKRKVEGSNPSPGTAHDSRC